MPFEKRWLDDNVVPLLEPNKLTIYSFLWNGNPPEDVLVWLRSTCSVDLESGLDFDPLAWGESVKSLLDQGWRFDYQRDQLAVQVDGQIIKAFGSDGAPLLNQDGMASTRLFQKTDGGVNLILQIGCKFPPGDNISAGVHAAAAIKGFFTLFEEENALQVCAKYGAVFGAA